MLADTKMDVFGCNRDLRLGDFLDGDALHLSNNMGNTSNSHRLVPALDHETLLPLFLLDRLG